MYGPCKIVGTIHNAGDRFPLPLVAGWHGAVIEDAFGVRTVTHWQDAEAARVAAIELANGASEEAWGDDDDEDSPDMIRSCDGHESLDGAHMGETVYCDGTCNR